MDWQRRRLTRGKFRRRGFQGLDWRISVETRSAPSPSHFEGRACPSPSPPNHPRSSPTHPHSPIFPAPAQTSSTLGQPTSTKVCSTTQPRRHSALGGVLAPLLCAGGLFRSVGEWSRTPTLSLSALPDRRLPAVTREDNQITTTFCLVQIHLPSHFYMSDKMREKECKGDVYHRLLIAHVARSCLPHQPTSYRRCGAAIASSRGLAGLAPCRDVVLCHRSSPIHSLRRHRRCKLESSHAPVKKPVASLL